MPARLLSALFVRFEPLESHDLAECQQNNVGVEISQLRRRIEVLAHITEQAGESSVHNVLIVASQIVKIEDFRGKCRVLGSNSRSVQTGEDP